MYVYAMVNAGNPSLIKIGKSDEPVRRVKELNNAKYGKVLKCNKWRVFKTIYVGKNALKTENRIHRELKGMGTHVTGCPCGCTGKIKESELFKLSQANASVILDFFEPKEVATRRKAEEARRKAEEARHRVKLEREALERKEREWEALAKLQEEAAKKRAEKVEEADAIAAMIKIFFFIISLGAVAAFGLHFAQEVLDNNAAPVSSKYEKVGEFTYKIKR